jgi:hypothetical protein
MVELALHFDPVNDRALRLHKQLLQAPAAAAPDDGPKLPDGGPAGDHDEAILRPARHDPKQPPRPARRE